MKEIAGIPWNGYKVISLFSGAGGSSLGYRLAGFKVLWASEFVEAARLIYRANASPRTIIGEKDIRETDPAAVMRELRIAAGDLDILDGSPPCSSFSTSGARQRGWGKEKTYSDTVQRTDDLFFEYVRFVNVMQPKVFVAENVSGLIRGAAQGYFLEILEAMQACGYRVEAKLLDAQWLGVPQRRKRLIFVGVRSDLGHYPVFPSPESDQFSLSHAINDLDPATIDPETDISSYAISKEAARLNPGTWSRKYVSLEKAVLSLPCPTITASISTRGAASVIHPAGRKFSIAELKRICSFPDDFKMSGEWGKDSERLGRAVPPIMMKKIAAAIRDGILAKL